MDPRKKKRNPCRDVWGFLQNIHDSSCLTDRKELKREVDAKYPNDSYHEIISPYL